MGFVLALAECFDYEKADNESANGEVKTGVLPFDSTWAGLDPECAQFLALSCFFIFNVKVNSFG